jgi:hypothetical protein
LTVDDDDDNHSVQDGDDDDDDDDDDKEGHALPLNFSSALCFALSNEVR